MIYFQIGAIAKNSLVVVNKVDVVAVGVEVAAELRGGVTDQIRACRLEGTAIPNK